MSIEEKAIKKSSSFLYYKGYNIIVDNDNNASSTNKSNNKHTASHQSHFLLCEDCFWCATYLLNDCGGTTILKCPVCNNAKVESLPMIVEL
jgi:hypothetical protein